MFHDPLIAEIRQIRAEIMAENGHDLHNLCENLRRDQTRWTTQGHPVIVAPINPNLISRMREMQTSQKVSA